MQSNPTYDAQINQFDRRVTAGGRFNRTLIDRYDLGFDVGAEFRHDDIGPVGLDENESGQFIANISNNTVKETSLGLYAEGTWLPTPDLRLLAGLRADHDDFDADAINPTSFAGSASDSLVSPSAGLAYAASNHVELYASWGRGFHSNDARGVVNHLDPLQGLAPGTGYEAGARFEFGDIKLTTTYRWLDLDSELIFVGDSNSVEPRGGSNREGYELTMFWKPLAWLGIDAVFTDNQAHYVDNPDGRHIEGSLENASQIGFSAVRDNWEAALRVRYLGPLRPDARQRAPCRVEHHGQPPRILPARFRHALRGTVQSPGQRRQGHRLLVRSLRGGFRSSGPDFRGYRLRHRELPDEPSHRAAHGSRRRQMAVLTGLPLRRSKAELSGRRQVPWNGCSQPQGRIANRVSSRRRSGAESRIRP